jgi:hypothetical protein
LTGAEAFLSAKEINNAQTIFPGYNSFGGRVFSEKCSSLMPIPM